MVETSHFEILHEFSFLGWAFHEGGHRYDPLARISPGFLRTHSRDGNFGVFLSYELSRVSWATFGTEVYRMHRNGFNYAFGTNLGIDGRPGVMAALGYYAARLEYQFRDSEEYGRMHVFSWTLAIPVLEMADEFTYLRRTE